MVGPVINAALSKACLRPCPKSFDWVVFRTISAIEYEFAFDCFGFVLDIISAMNE